MKQFVSTNDPVLLSFVEALLRDAEIEHIVADRNMSVMEGSIGILPRRVLVRQEDWHRAKRILDGAGLEDVIADE